MSRHEGFPSTSIGRAQGRLQRIPSRESLAAHPLLTTNTQEAPRYVPYTPRQRVPTPAATTTGTTLALPPLSSSSAASDATSKLQAMSLKAAAQNISLDATSVGWAILEKLVSGDVESYPEWTDIWTIVTSGKGTLLLPLEQLSSSTKITLDLVKDHVVLCEGASRRNGQVITLSGLRGILDGEKLTIRSSLAPSSKAFQNLLATAGGLGSLPPLPLISSGAPYPSFALPSYVSSFPLPPRPPPLPPRPNSTVRSASASLTPAQSSSSRLAIPFAGLFGRSSSTPPPVSSTPPSTSKPLPASQTPVTSPSTETPSMASPVAETLTQNMTSASVFTISHRLVFTHLAKEVCRALKTEINNSLQINTPNPITPTTASSQTDRFSRRPSQLVPRWITEKVHDFTTPLYPFVKPRRRSDPHASARFHVPNPLEESAEYLSEMIQEFYATLEVDLRERTLQSSSLKYGVYHRKKSDHGNAESTGLILSPVEAQGEYAAYNPSFYSYNGHATDDNSSLNDSRSSIQEKDDKVSVAGDLESSLILLHDDENDESEIRIREILEAVEQTITELFYDRLFHLPTSDDSSHDEALSSRVAALNMLDLGLEHLDISVAQSETGGEQEEVSKVVKACGEMLSQLDTKRNPAAKAALMVEAHKIVVNGLSQLPPIKLKSELEDMQSPVPTLRSPPPLPTREDMVSHQDSSPPPSEVVEPPSEGEAATDKEAKVLTLEVPPELVTGVDPPSELISTTSTEPPPEEASGPPPPPVTGQGVPPVTPQSSTLLTPDPASSTVSSTVFPDTPAIPPTPYSSASTTLSGDVLFPLIIFSVVKANPPQLVSNLLFTQRFRNRSIGGEESYCLINLMAVAEFLENVDMSALGLEGGGKVMPSTADLTPIPVVMSPVPDINVAAAPGFHVGNPLLGSGIRTQVDSITAGAGKVFTGVVDSSFGMLRSLMPSSNASTPLLDGIQSSAPWNNHGTPKSPVIASNGFGMLKREGASNTGGFGIQSILGIVPGATAIVGGDKEKEKKAQTGEELVEVGSSRPASIRSKLSAKLGGSDLDTDSEDSDGGEEDSSGEEESGEEDGGGGAPDTRSIKSFESMMSERKTKIKAKPKGSSRKELLAGSLGRKSLTDRLASVSGSLSGLAHKSSPAPKSLVLPSTADVSPESSRSHSPPVSHPTLSIAPPKKRFLECSAGDLRIAEVEELLVEYKRLVEGIRNVGGFTAE